MDGKPQDQSSKEQDLPSQVEESRKTGAKHRRELDEIPPPGTDPLHEGP